LIQEQLKLEQKGDHLGNDSREKKLRLTNGKNNDFSWYSYININAQYSANITYIKTKSILQENISLKKCVTPF
jgi:hypothetical protein